MLTNSRHSPESNLFSLVLRKEFDFGVDLMLGYAYTTAEDVVPMTSAVAFSNFNNLATLDINAPRCWRFQLCCATSPDPPGQLWVLPVRGA